MLSCYFIVKNAADTLERTLQSVKPHVDELVVIDDGSTDRTAAIAKAAGARVVSFINPSEGEKRIFAVQQCKGDWILCLDADEVVTTELARELHEMMRNKEFDGYLIPFQNHFLGHPLHHGGEDYLALRLFRKSASQVENTPIHAYHTVAKERTGKLENKLLHYSHRSLWQVYAKFTNYAVREAYKKKRAGEKTGLKQITMYPVHMFWARYIKDKGYKDGIIRIPLDLGFAYMEWLTYILMFFI